MRICPFCEDRDIPAAVSPAPPTSIANTAATFAVATIFAMTNPFFAPAANTPTVDPTEPADTPASFCINPSGNSRNAS